jgi:hypothetical protein
MQKRNSDWDQDDNRLNDFLKKNISLQLKHNNDPGREYT